MASSPLVEIGAHTMSHCSLPDLPPYAQLEEILGSLRQCRELTGEFPSGFAYPFGRFDAGTPELVRSAGFDRRVRTRMNSCGTAATRCCCRALPCGTTRAESSPRACEWHGCHEYSSGGEHRTARLGHHGYVNYARSAEQAMHRLPMTRSRERPACARSAAPSDDLGRM